MLTSSGVRLPIKLNTPASLENVEADVAVVFGARPLAMGRSILQSVIAVLRLPFRACKMALPQAACSGWLADGIDADNQKRCFVPLGSVALGIEETRQLPIHPSP
jgi:hypothetical protein